MEGDGEVFDQRAAVAQRQRGRQRPLGAEAVGRGKDLLRGHVGHKAAAVGGQACAALPDVVLRKADGKIGAKAVFIVQTVKVLAVEPFDALGQVFLVRRPGRCGVAAVRAGGLQDHRVERIHRLALQVIRKNLQRPLRAGVGRDQPGRLARHTALAALFRSG